VEAIGHDLRLREMLSDQCTVHARQVHTDDPHPVLARQLRQIIFQGGFTAAEHHIEDPVRPQIAEGGRVSILPREEMLIDAEHAGARGAAPFGELAVQEILEPALDRGTAYVLSLAQTAAVHAVIMRHEDATAERLRRPFPRQNPGKALPKAPAAVFAPEFAGFQFQDAMPQPQALVPRLAHPLIFEPQPIALAVRTRSRPDMPGRDPDLPRHFFNACNLVSRQTEHRF
jgi:hypothetical protein